MKLLRQNRRLSESSGRDVMDRQLQAVPAQITIAPVVAKKGKGDRAAGSGPTAGLDMSTTSDSIAISIEEVLEQIESLLLKTWQSTGFGSLTIESDRKRQKIQVIIKAGTHFRYVISDEDIVKWVSRQSSQGD